MERRFFFAVIAAIGLGSAIAGFRACLMGPISGGGIEVTNAVQFGIQDNHTRFYAALWAGAGLLMVYALFDLAARKLLLQGVCFLFFVGGIGRLLHLDPEILGTPDVASAVAVELLLFPALALWLRRIEPESGEGVPA